MKVGGWDGAERGPLAGLPAATGTPVLKRRRTVAPAACSGSFARFGLVFGGSREDDYDWSVERLT